MKKAIATLLSLAQLLAASALSYDELLARAQAYDPGLARLSIEERQAEIAYERSTLAKDRLTLSAETGSVSADFSGSNSYASAAPAASLRFPDGRSLSMSTPIALSSSGAFAKPSLGLTLPLIRGPDDGLVAVETARLALDRARVSRSQARLALEKSVVAKLKSALESEIALQAALRDEAKAERELKRAVAVDGAEPGGTAYMRLQRALRASARTRRDADAKKAESLVALRAITGAVTDSEAEILPSDYPETDLARPLTGHEGSLAVAQKRVEGRLAELEGVEAERRSILSANLGTGYGIGSSAVGAEKSIGGSGLELSGGLDAALGPSGLKISGGFSWRPGSSPSASLSLAWAPPPRGDEALRSEDLALSAKLRERALADAVEAASAATSALEGSRRGLLQAAEDAEEDLAFAEAQLAAYTPRRADGLVSELEYEEILAERDGCIARSRVAKLDRMAWDIEARLLSEGAEEYGDDR